MLDLIPTLNFMWLSQKLLSTFVKHALTTINRTYFLAFHDNKMNNYIEESMPSLARSLKTLNTREKKREITCDKRNIRSSRKRWSIWINSIYWRWKDNWKCFPVVKKLFPNLKITTFVRVLHASKHNFIKNNKGCY